MKNRMFRNTFYGLLAAALFSCFGNNKNVLRDQEIVSSALERYISQPQTDSEKTEKYAVLINGEFSSLLKYKSLHEKNISLAYKTLKRFGFEDKNIFILSSSNPRRKNQNVLTINANGSEENFRQIAGYLEKAVDENDLLVIYGTGHGFRANGRSFICLDGPADISAKEYKEILERINAGTTVSVMDQCYSGEFPNELQKSKLRLVAIADSDEDKHTYCKHFAKSFWSSFEKRKTDSNKDGCVSFREAYNFAIQKHKRKLLNKKECSNGKYFSSIEEEVFLE